MAEIGLLSQRHNQKRMQRGKSYLRKSKSNFEIMEMFVDASFTQSSLPVMLRAITNFQNFIIFKVDVTQNSSFEPDLNQ